MGGFFNVHDKESTVKEPQVSYSEENSLSKKLYEDFLSLKLPRYQRYIYFKEKIHLIYWTLTLASMA